MELKQVLIEFRKENKISQRQFAKNCGLSNSLISILEMGVNPQTGNKPSPDVETYKKLAIGMGISMQTLFEKIGDSEMVDLRTPARVVVRDSELFLKIMDELTVDEYYIVMDIFNDAEKRLRERGEL